LKVVPHRRTPRAARAHTAPPFPQPLSLTELLESRRLLSVGAAAVGVTDDFNDGNDAGWTHYDPLSAFQAPDNKTVYEVVDGHYRIATPPSADPAQLGPARAGSVREDAVLSDFAVSVDLVDWDTSLNQAFGILARVSTPGLGTTNGYALSINAVGALDISVITGEVPDDIDPGVSALLDPSANDYRLVFEGRGTNLTGKLFNLNDLVTPIMTTHATDATYASGSNGVFIFDNTRAASGSADVTFDNFSATVAPPADRTIAYYRFEEGTAGQPLPPPTADGGPDSGLAVDSAGHDDSLRTFSSLTTPTYSSDVPAATVPATGQANRLSLDLTPNQDIYTAQRGDLNNHKFDQFTIEASFNADVVTWSNIVGKDGKPLPDVAIAPLQFKLRDDTKNLQIEIIDAAGTEKQVQTLAPIETGRWYHAAAVNDGTTLSLYLDDTTVPGGYVLQGSVPVSGGLFPSDATWDVGRGYFNGNITDWFDGKIDEVRISDVALQPSQFLFAQGTTNSPHVTQVYVSGSTWTDAFKQYLQAQGQGSGQYGYAIPATAQLATLPWANLDRVSVTFDQDVTAHQADLAVRGVTVPNYAVTGYTYDAATKTGTWTLGQPLRNDKVLLDLNADAGGVSSTGGALDGDWNNAGDTFPSGDGTAGGDLRFRFNVLPGDTNRNGTVVADDFSDVKKKFFKSTTNPGAGDTGYTVFHDVDGNGSIVANDFSEVKKRFFNTLPAGEPSAAAVASLFGDNRLSDDRVAASVLA
jgi:hypothetical protein